MDSTIVRNPGAGEILTPVTVAATEAGLRQPDYAWTHEAPVEGFFAVLTVVIVPMAILRLLRRLRRRGANI